MNHSIGVTDDTALAAAGEPRTRRVPSARPRAGTSATDLTIESAAQRLEIAPEALRARCRRAARRHGRDVIAQLGGGVTAYKFGRTWRVRFVGDNAR
jgi:hypothetical protein